MRLPKSQESLEDCSPGDLCWEEMGVLFLEFASAERSASSIIEAEQNCFVRPSKTRACGEIIKPEAEWYRPQVKASFKPQNFYLIWEQE